jgi:hypothetical protein
VENTPLPQEIYCKGQMLFRRKMKNYDIASMLKLCDASTSLGVKKGTGF